MSKTIGTPSRVSVMDSKLIKALFSSCDPDSYMTFWLKHKNGSNQTIWMKICELLEQSDAVVSTLKSIDAAVSNGCNVYTSTGTSRTCGKPRERIGRNHPPYQAAAFFMDIDTKLDDQKASKAVPATPDKVLEDLEKLPHRPSLCVCSGQGIHAYWLLNSPIAATQEDMSAFAKGIRDSLNRLPGNSYTDEAGAVRGCYDDIDTHASEPCRVLRVDGTLNYKQDPPLPVYVVSYHPERVYTPFDIRLDFQQKPAPAPKQPDPAAAQMRTATPNEDPTGADYIAIGLQKDPKFAQMWNGSVHSDASRQDQALMGKIYHWSGADAAGVVEIFKRSPWFGIRTADKPEKMDREDYLLKTAERAIAGHTGKTAPELDADYQASKQISQKDPDRIVFDRFVMADELQAHGYTIRLNDITMQMDVIGQTDSGRSMKLEDLVLIMYDELKCKYKRVSMDAIEQNAAYYAREHHYNPVLEHLNGLTWDGSDRVEDLCSRVLHIDTDDTLSRALVRKWLLQSVCLMYNRIDGGMEEPPFGADGVLTFTGEQGLGKTRFFSRLTLHPDWFKEGGKISDWDKDDQRRVLTAWITELGEVECTMKSDVSALKAFVTESRDKYRLPYGRNDIDVPRHTSMCATCNSDEYLIDPTGNRRWWTIPTHRRISFEIMTPTYTRQLWAQIYQTVSALSYTEKGSCFRLTEDEQAQLAIRNGSHEKPMKGEVEVRDLLDRCADDPQYAVIPISATDWRSMHIDALRSYSAVQIGKVLKKLGISEGSHRKYWLPVLKSTAEYVETRKKQSYVTM